MWRAAASPSPRARPVEWSGPVELDGYRNWAFRAFALGGLWDLWARPTVESAYAPEELVLYLCSHLTRGIGGTWRQFGGRADHAPV